MDVSLRPTLLAHPRRTLSAALLGASLALTACSSGGGDSPESSAPSADTGDLRLYVLWGQSHMRGGVGAARVIDVTDPDWLDWAQYSGSGPYPALDGCWIYDKSARGRLGWFVGGELVGQHFERLQHSRIDDTPGFLAGDTTCWPSVTFAGEENQLRPLTAGYAGGEELEADFQGVVAPFGPHCQADDFYPWAEGNQVPYPRFGPEVPFARAIRDATGDDIVLVKLAIGGTTVSVGEAGWNPAQGGEFDYLRLLEETYFDHTVELATEMLEPGQRLLLGGVISSIGLSDMRPPSHLTFEDGYRDVIDHLRDHVSGPAEGEDVPYLIVQTPTPDVFLRPEEWEIFYGIRASQVLLAETLPGVAEIDPDEVAVSQSDGEFHFDADGNIAFGEQMAAWAASVADDAIVLHE
ncbi:MAG: sialate O-acetylesterase [Planctomycetota bacterium]